MSWIDAIIIAIVEGITEFLPISSTGHMMICQHLLGVESTPFLKAYIVNIQFGAILSVLVLYWRKFFFLKAKNSPESMNPNEEESTLASKGRFYLKLVIAFIPAAVIGFLAGDFIDSMLENILVVAIALVLGGIILLFVDKWFSKISEDQSISNSKAFKIGFFQVIAMIPGVSRSAATIIGGMVQKLSRKTAAEFSFFLAVPTMFAASAYKLLKTYHDISAENIKMLIVGNLVAFAVAFLAIKFFIGYLSKHGFRSFGFYRIIVGVIIIGLILSGAQLQVL